VVDLEDRYRRLGAGARPGSGVRLGLLYSRGHTKIARVCCATLIELNQKGELFRGDFLILASLCRYNDVSPPCSEYRYAKRILVRSRQRAHCVNVQPEGLLNVTGFCTHLT
jgi:hypothetical protein